MNDSDTKKHLLVEFDDAWSQIEHRCAGLNETQMVAPGAMGEWSVKDILAHLSAWEKYLLDRLGFVMTRQPPQYPVMVSIQDVDCFNAQVFVDNKERSLNSVMLEFRSLYHGVKTVLEAMDDELLHKPYDYDWPDDGLNLLQLIRANTTDHFKEHFAAIDKVVKHD